MSLKLSSLGLFVAAAAFTLPACPFRKSSDGGAAEVAKQAGVGLVKPSGPVKIATTHPRLFVREADLPRLRSWAASSNPIFENGLKALVHQCAQTMDTSTML